MPFVLTVAIISWVAQLVYEYVAAPMSHLIAVILKRAMDARYHPAINDVFQEWSVKALGFFVAVMLVMLVGALVLPAVGRRMVSFFEGSLVRVPLIKLIYPRVKQLIDFLFSKPRISEFRQVVAVEYPRDPLRKRGAPQLNPQPCMVAPPEARSSGLTWYLTLQTGISRWRWSRR